MSSTKARWKAVDTAKRGRRIEELANLVHKQIVGQQRAINHIIRSLTIYEAGLHDAKRPIVYVILAGPPETGKTETAKAFASAWISNSASYDDDAPLTFIDCSEFSERHTVASLIGAPPGYLGHGKPPILHQREIDRHDFQQRLKKLNVDLEQALHSRVERIEQECGKELTEKEFEEERRKFYEMLYEQLGPYKSVILFDEVDRADQRLWNLLLNIFEEGKLTLHDGSQTSFANSVIVLTTNIGSAQSRSSSEREIGFLRGSGKAEDPEVADQGIYKTVVRHLKQNFPPALMSRLRREVVVFHPLRKQHLAQILDMFLDRAGERFASSPSRLKVEYRQEFRKFLLEKGTGEDGGPRTLRDDVKKYVTDKIASGILSEEIREGDSVAFSMRGNEPVLLRAPRSSG